MPFKSWKNKKITEWIVNESEKQARGKKRTQCYLITFFSRSSAPWRYYSNLPSRLQEIWESESWWREFFECQFEQGCRGGTAGARDYREAASGRKWFTQILQFNKTVIWGPQTTYSWVDTKIIAMLLSWRADGSSIFTFYNSLNWVMALPSLENMLVSFII